MGDNTQRITVVHKKFNKTSGVMLAASLAVFPTNLAAPKADCAHGLVMFVAQALLAVAALVVTSRAMQTMPISDVLSLHVLEVPWDGQWIINKIYATPKLALAGPSRTAAK